MGSHEIALSLLLSILGGIVAAAIWEGLPRRAGNQTTRSGPAGPFLGGMLVVFLVALLVLSPDLPILGNARQTESASPIENAAAITTPPPAVPAQLGASDCIFAVAGENYPSLSSASGSDDPFRAVWTSDGRLWQPGISTVTQPAGFSILAEIPAGDYTFNGVGGTVYRDDSKATSAQGLTVLASGGNGIQFSILTAGNQTAWILVVGAGGTSSGFEIKRVGRLC